MKNLVQIKTIEIEQQSNKKDTCGNQSNIQPSTQTNRNKPTSVNFSNLISIPTKDPSAAKKPLVNKCANIGYLNARSVNEKNR